MSHLLFHRFSFFTTLVATRRCRCLLRSARANVMPERLLSVISGILTGIPGFRSDLCCFYHPLAGMALWMLAFSPFCLYLRPYHDVMTQGCHLLHESANELVASHSSFVVGFCFVFVLFWCLFLPVFGLLLMMTASWTMYRSFTSSLL